MEVNPVYRHPVDLALGLGDAAVDLQNLSLDGLRHGKAGNQGLNIGQGGMGMGVLVVVFMRMFVFMPVLRQVLGGLLLLTVDADMHVGAEDAAFLGGFRGVDNPRKPQAVEGSQGFFPVRHQLQQGGGEHIPGSAHAKI